MYPGRWHRFGSNEAGFLAGIALQLEPPRGGKLPADPAINLDCREGRVYDWKRSDVAWSDLFRLQRLVSALPVRRGLMTYMTNFLNAGMNACESGLASL